MTEYIAAALSRVQSSLNCYDVPQPAELLADIMHYCREHKIDFDSELHRARGYVDCELEHQQGLTI